MDARAAYDVIAATDACEPAGSNLKFHLISIGDRMTCGLVLKPFWVDIRDMLADGTTEGGIGRLLLHNVSNDCKYQAIREAFLHQKNQTGSATIPPSKEK